MSRSSIVVVVASACLVAATAATAGSLAFVRTYSFQGDFVDDDGNVATDLSGLACMALPARHCLAVNDENQTAQFATLEDGRILPQATISLIGPQPSAATVGTAVGPENSNQMKPPRSKLRGITRKSIICETPRFLKLFPLQGNPGASSEESPD